MEKAQTAAVRAMFASVNRPPLATIASARAAQQASTHLRRCHGKQHPRAERVTDMPVRATDARVKKI
jgi:hypothetical protein